MIPLVSIILIILFIVLMIFVLSMALLTPIIGKRNFISVIVIGFIVGAIGGAFLLTPVYEDIPNMSRGFHQMFSSEPETIQVEVSTKMDLNKFISNLKKQDGVKNVKSSFIELKIDNLTDKQVGNIDDRLSILNPNFTNYTVHKNGSVFIEYKEGTNPTKAITELEEWLMYTSEITTRYSIVNIDVEVEASKVRDVQEYINKSHVVIKGVKGPVENKVKSIDNFLPPNYVMIIFSGLLGVIVGLVGIFLDEITRFLQRLKDNLNERR